MGIEDKFTPESNILKKQIPEKKDGKSSITRRDFLKKLGKIGAGAAVAATGAKGGYELAKQAGIIQEEGEDLSPEEKERQLKEEFDYREGIKEGGPSESEPEELEPQEELKPTKEQENIIESDIMSIKDVLNYDNEGRLEFNMETVEKIKNRWKKLYSEDEKYVTDFRKAYYEMGKWKPYLLAAFKRKGMSNKEAMKIMYLAIPESGFRTKAVSPAGAKGPYQFMGKTARQCGLSIGRDKREPKNLDERMDPIKSAEACACNIKDIYKKSDNDLDIALAGYNGSYIWKYLGGVNYRNINREKGTLREKKTYEDFVKFMEGKINELRDSIKNDILVHKVGTGDTLSSIADKYYTTVEEITRANNIKIKEKIKNGKKTTIAIIHPGQELTIPIPEQNKEKAWDKLSKGFAENMVYPAKFHAVSELIDEGFVDKQAKPLTFKTTESPNNITKTIKIHTVKSGQNLYRIGLKHGVSLKAIKEYNGLKNDEIKPNQKLKIPGKEAPTLKSMADILKVDYSRLAELNPAIINSNKPLPAKYKVRY